MRRDSLAILSHKRDVDTHLVAFLRSAQIVQSPWTKDSITRIKTFATAGKTVRGSLVVYSYRLFKKDLPDHVLDAAGAIELLHSGLLIHDDVFDQDMIRRGMPSIHSQYEQFAESKKGKDAPHFAFSQAINLGDLCFFLGSMLLSSAGSRITRFVHDELSRVAFAQMQDVAGGHLPDTYTRDDVIALYRSKTARYTFSMPMVVGATLADVGSAVLMSLQELGECLGLLYQIRDDELNNGGDTSVTGKSAGSDVSNGKQTLLSIIPEAELSRVKGEQRVHAQHIIRSLPVSAPRQQELSKLLSFCETRER